MATAHLADYTVTQVWTNLAATVTGAASVEALFQNIGSTPVQIAFGGASAPTTSSGIMLGTMDSVQGNAAQVWVRGIQGGVLSVATV